MDTHEVLVKARNLLEREGWIQNGMHRTGEGYCALGALKASNDDSLAMPVCDAWCHALRPLIDGEGIGFNNAPGRTKEEVLAWFDAAIAATAPEPADPFPSEQPLVTA